MCLTSISFSLAALLHEENGFSVQHFQDLVVVEPPARGYQLGEQVQSKMMGGVLAAMSVRTLAAAGKNLEIDHSTGTAGKVDHLVSHSKSADHQIHPPKGNLLKKTINLLSKPAIAPDFPGR